MEVGPLRSLFVLVFALGSTMTVHAQERVAVIVDGDAVAGTSARSVLVATGVTPVPDGELAAARQFVLGTASGPIDDAGVERLRAELGLALVVVVRVRAQGATSAVAVTALRATGSARRFATAAAGALSDEVARLTGELLRDAPPESAGAPASSPANAGAAPPTPETPPPSAAGPVALRLQSASRSPFSVVVTQGERTEACTTPCELALSSGRVDFTVPGTAFHDWIELAPGPTLLRVGTQSTANIRDPIIGMVFGGVSLGVGLGVFFAGEAELAAGVEDSTLWNAGLAITIVGAAFLAVGLGWLFVELPHRRLVVLATDVRRAMRGEVARW